MITLTTDENNLFKMLVFVAQSKNVTLRVAGGWVRDKLLGLQSHDIDIAVQGCSGLEFANYV